MDEIMMIHGIAALMEVISQGQWKANNPITLEQARMYLAGIRDHRIADTTIGAVDLADKLASEKNRGRADIEDADFLPQWERW